MNDSYDNKLVKAKSNTVTRYSNALIRRAIDEIAGKTQDLTQSTKKKKKVLFVILENNVVDLLEQAFKNTDIDVTIYEPPIRNYEVSLEVTNKNYDLVIATNWGIPANQILLIAQQARELISPNIKIMAISGHHPVSFQAQLKASGIDTILSLPFQQNVLLQSIRNELSPTTDNRVSILLSWSLDSSFKYWLDALGFNVLWADNPKELEEIAISNNIDLAIEWQSGQLRQHRYPSLDMLNKLGKVVPIYLSLNMGLDEQTNFQELGYVDTLAAPWVLDEMRQKFLKMLTPEKQEILKKTQFWTYKE